MDSQRAFVLELPIKPKRKGNKLEYYSTAIWTTRTGLAVIAGVNGLTVLLLSIGLSVSALRDITDIAIGKKSRILEVLKIALISSIAIGSYSVIVNGFVLMFDYMTNTIDSNLGDSYHLLMVTAYDRLNDEWAEAGRFDWRLHGTMFVSWLSFQAALQIKNLLLSMGSIFFNVFYITGLFALCLTTIPFLENVFRNVFTALIFVLSWKFLISVVILIISLHSEAALTLGFSEVDPIALQPDNASESVDKLYDEGFTRFLAMNVGYVLTLILVPTLASVMFTPDPSTAGMMASAGVALGAQKMSNMTSRTYQGTKSTVSHYGGMLADKLKGKDKDKDKPSPPVPQPTSDLSK